MKDAQEYAEKVEEGTRQFVSDVRAASARSDLYRSPTDRYVGGVCGGLGERFNIDPTIIRIIFLTAMVFGGTGIWIYLALWAFVPVKDEFELEPESLSDLPPMPHSGPYVDVPGVDPVESKTQTKQPTPDQPTQDPVNGEDEPPTSGPSQAQTPVAESPETHTPEDFPKPDTIL